MLATTMFFLGVSVFAPIALMLNKSVDRQKRLLYNGYIFVTQIGLGCTCYYSLRKMEGSIKTIDNKYFSEMNLEQLNNYTSQINIPYPPGVDSIGPVLANSNRQPFGGAPGMYYNPAPQNTQSTQKVQNVANDQTKDSKDIV